MMEVNKKLNKILIIIGIILLTGLVIGLGGVEGITEGLTTAKTVEKKDLTLKPSFTSALASMQTKTELVCGEWLTNCLEYEKCLKLDEKTGECLEWDKESKCIKEENVCNRWDTNTTTIGISKVIITPRGNNCYDIVSEPMLHRYNTCLKEGQDVMVYVEKDLSQIATHIEEEKGKENRDPVVDENILEVTLK